MALYRQFSWRFQLLDRITAIAQGDSAPPLGQAEAMSPASACATRKPRFSLIVATIERQAPLLRLFQSLEHQRLRDFEVIVVDQNTRSPLREILAPERWPFSIRHLHTGPCGGASVARNQGWLTAAGQILVFPDDDCWYPTGYLADMGALFDRTRAMLVTGRATDGSGRTINGRFERCAGPIDRSTAFTTQIEWNMGVSSRLMSQLGGYDPLISLGGPSPWQAGEGYDLVLRALARGAFCFYDPDLVAHHDVLPVHAPDAQMIRKGRIYARGLGYVLRKHRYGLASLSWWVMRSLANLTRAAIELRRDKMRYFWGQALGRYEGWSRRLVDAGRGSSGDLAQTHRRS